MRIVITGTPGTGKTKVAGKLAKILKIKLISLRDIVNKEKIFRIKNREKIADLKALDRKLKSLLKNEKDFVAEGHLACEIRMPADYVFVLRTHPDELKKRLSGRKYRKEKLNENIMCELLDYCPQRVLKVYGIKPIEIDTTGKTVGGTAGKIKAMIKNKKKKGDKVDYSKELMKHLGLKKHG